MTKVSLAIGLRTLFTVLGALMVATLLYTLFTDGFPFRIDLLTPWMTATLIDFYINIIALSVWVTYKESNWITSILWIILLICLGSITTCAYIVLQFMKLSSQESSQDPIYYVLLRHPNKSGTEPKRKHSFVVTLRIIFSILGIFMFGTLVYTIVTDGSPFRMELLTPWLTATLVDFYINIVALAVWVAYKESSWISSIFWIVLLISFGSITACVYIVWQLFQISSQDPVYLVLVHHGNRQNTLAVDKLMFCLTEAVDKGLTDNRRMKKTNIRGFLLVRQHRNGVHGQKVIEETADDTFPTNSIR